jgi:hypothetical protein
MSGDFSRRVQLREVSYFVSTNIYPGSSFKYLSETKASCFPHYYVSFFNVGAFNLLLLILTNPSIRKSVMAFSRNAACRFDVR